MDYGLEKMRAFLATPEQQEKTVAYLTEKIGTFLKKRERVLICLSEEEGGVGWAMGQAVLRCGGIPSYLGDDCRWKTIMRTAFSSHCATIVAEPLVLLGISKLAKAMGVPLFIRNAILTGYPCMRWMREGIQRGLDCNTYGCLDPGGIVVGFIDKAERELKLRTELFDAYARDASGMILPDQEQGEVVVRAVWDPGLEHPISHLGRVNHKPGEERTVTICDMAVGRAVEPDIAHLSGHLHRWTSILDCRVTRGDYGLELEIVTFPGEKLPKLPTCAKQVVRSWDPETEIPFTLRYGR